MEKHTALALEDYLKDYENSELSNNNTYTFFSALTDEIPYLKAHRDYIEAHKLGFGERAFHAMWRMILKDLVAKFGHISVLEIGVYKGQVISLWDLIAKKENLNIEIHGISPFKGNPIPKAGFFRILASSISKKFKEKLQNGNFYQDDDYFKVINDLFKKFELDFDKLNLYTGYSSDKNILDEISNKKFHAIYVDGDHTFAGVINDIQNYHKLIYTNGYLVMDDSACNIPGTVYWKGHQSVSDACKIIEDLGFVNILNVGHNRIYQKI